MSNHLWKPFYVICCFMMALELRAQLPPCFDTNTLFYFHGDGDLKIYNYDTKKPISATNPIVNTIPPSPGAGLAVSPNLTTGDPDLTFYAMGTRPFYYYYDRNSNTWVNTGHRFTGGLAACNMGAGGGYIYSVIGGSGAVYRYDGKGDDVYILLGSSAPNLGIVYDVIADNEGNFYLLSTDVPWSATRLPNWLRKYNPQGQLLQEWQVTGLKGVTPNAGFAIMDNAMYVDGFIDTLAPVVYDSLGNAYELDFLFKGEPCGNTIHFTMVDTITKAYGREFAMGDFANCPQRLYSYIKDTMCYKRGETLNIRSSSIKGPYSYTVLEGSAQVSGADRNFTVSPQTISATILLHGTDYCNHLRNDTFTFIRYPGLDAGPDLTIMGCGQYVDTLHATLRDTIAGINYSLQWSPSDFVITGQASLQPVIQPTTNTLFWLELSTPQCGHLKDSVWVTVKDVTVMAGFSFDYNYGCTSDTVTFNNTSVNNTQNRWSFGDHDIDDGVNPVHAYLQQAKYKVTLLSWNEWCVDSITKEVDTRHPLIASFIMEKDTICMGDPVRFTNTSEGTFAPLRYHWNFGDGPTDTNFQTQHVFTHPGEYKVQLVVTDNISCSDTFAATVLVDSLPELSLNIDPQTLCVGQSVTVEVNYCTSGNTGISWDLGDAGFVTGKNEVGYEQVHHAYPEAGIFPIQVTAHYRACKALLATNTVYVSAPPLVYLGSADALCLKGIAVNLKNLKINPPGYRYLWNTGDTTEQITARHPGKYSLTITNKEHCTGTESIILKKDCYIDMPNAFTPNGDGDNDYFFPRQLLSQSGTSFKMQILNRWGQVIFETTNMEGRGWDGQFNGEDQPIGVYVYVLEITFKEEQSEIYQGNVTLIR